MFGEVAVSSLVVMSLNGGDFKIAVVCTCCDAIEKGWRFSNNTSRSMVQTAGNYKKEIDKSAGWEGICLVPRKVSFIVFFWLVM